MVVVTTFLMNLMCALVSCDPVYEAPTAAPPTGYRSARNLDRDSENSLFETRRTEPFVNTSSGAVEGYFMTVVNGRQIYAFEGIPYAEPPIGFLRYKAPVRKPNWRGVLQAKNPGPLCLQLHLVKLARVVGQEDCLTLNVYAPEIPRKKYNPSLPVIIFIHGGSFFFGGGQEYGPSYLLQHDVVLVTVNYRLGVLGFLSTGDEESPGNYGLKDQVLAIKWIAANIARFGGDPKRITLMGQSAGGVAVHFHMMHNDIKPLLNNAISLSSSAFVPWAVFTPHQARKWAEKFARKLNCPDNNGTRALMDCVRGRNPNFVVANQLNLYDFLIFPPVLLRPAIEPNLPGAMITEMPEVTYAKGNVAKIPWISTTTTEEAEFVIIYLEGLGILRTLIKQWNLLAAKVFDYDRIVNDTSQVTKKIVKFYLGNKDPSTASKEVFSDVGSDRYFTLGIRKGLRTHCQVAPTYSYIFGYKSLVGLAAAWGNDFHQYGVPHGEDLAFIFNSTTYWKSLSRTDPGFAISKLVVNLISNFAAKSEPLYTDDTGNDVHIWDRITNPKDIRFLQVNEEVKMIPEPFPERVAFWEKLNLNDRFDYPKA